MINFIVGNWSNRVGIDLNLVCGWFGLNGGGNVSYFWFNLFISIFIREDCVGDLVRIFL